MAGPLRGLLLRDSDDDGGMAEPGESQRPQREDIMLLICPALCSWDAGLGDLATLCSALSVAPDETG